MRYSCYDTCRVDLGGALCIDRREIQVSLIPAARLRASAYAGIDLFILRGGLGVEADLVTIALVPTLTFGEFTPRGVAFACSQLCCCSPSIVLIRYWL